jgi:hypothetical protein
LKQNVAAIFAQFRDERFPEMGVSMGARHSLITVHDATNRVVWERFAGHLFDGYNIPAGKKGGDKSV